MMLHSCRIHLSSDPTVLAAAATRKERQRLARVAYKERQVVLTLLLDCQADLCKETVLKSMRGARQPTKGTCFWR